jgi:hypothetical protein
MDIVRKQKEAAQPTLVRQALERIAPQRALFIVDDLDPASDNGSVMKFLSHPHQGTKIITITSERINSWNDAHGNSAQHMRIEELQDREDVLQLIRFEFESRKIPLLEAVAHKLGDSIGQVPGALRLIMGEFRPEFPPDMSTIETMVEELTAQGGEVAARCFDRLIGLIQGKPALTVLHALALFPNGASRQTLESLVAGLDDGKQTPFRSLIKLQDLSLVHGYENRYWMSPLTREYTRQLMSEHELGRLQHRFVDYFLTLARNHGTQDCWLDSIDWESTYVIEHEWANIWQAIELAKKLERWSDVVFFEYYLFHSLAYHDRWTERLKLGDLAINAMKELEAKALKNPGVSIIGPENRTTC